MVLIGDFHQFPPVGNASGALYCTPSFRNTSMVGKALYLQFLTVVTLTKQERIKDHQWTQILQRARVGECTGVDIGQVRKLVLTNPACAIPDFGSEPWSSAVLVTPRNSVRAAWNRATIRKHSAQTGNIIYVSEAEDSVGNSRLPLTMEQKVIVARMKTADAKGVKGTKKLHHRVEIAIGMKVMVTLNLATEADLANSSRGTIHDIILDPREQINAGQIDEYGIVWLQYPPAMILFKPFHYEFEPFPGLEPGLIPIFPSEVSFIIHTGDNPKTMVHQRQYPLMGAYAFTDHKAQEQTIEYVVVDIGPTRRFPVDPFTAYVALSRSRGMDNIRLLRDFDNKIFTHHPSEALRTEDTRLDSLTEDTTIHFEMGFYDYK